MSRDEIREIAQIVGGDRAYKHFVKRINKEFEDADEKRNAGVFVIFIENSKGDKVGFSVIGYSPAKMRTWNKTFKEEGWVSEEFKIAPDAFELMYMYVKPEYRNKGYGVELFNKTFRFIKGKKVKEVYAYVGDRGSYILNFYKKMKANIIYDFSDETISSAFLRWLI